MAENYNSYNTLWIAAVIISIAILLSSNSIKVVYDSALPLDDKGDVEVQVQDYNGELVSFFVSQEKQLTTLSEDVIFQSTQINVTDSTGCVVGDALDLWDDVHYFQGIITGVTGNSINFVSSVVHLFNKTNTVVKCGEWNMNVDGSASTQRFYLNPPNNRSWDIESLNMVFKDNADWDISTFGSRPALSNGFTSGIRNGEFKKLFLIYDNSGFSLRGWEFAGFEKAPSGLYGFNTRLKFEEAMGSIPILNPYDRIIFNINDDLTSQTEIALTVSGHYKDD